MSDDPTMLEPDDAQFSSLLVDYWNEDAFIALDPLPRCYVCNGRRSWWCSHGWIGYPCVICNGTGKNLLGARPGK